MYSIGIINSKPAIFCNNQPFLKSAGRYSLTKAQAKSICQTLIADDNFEYHTKDMNPEAIDLFIDSLF